MLELDTIKENAELKAENAALKGQVFVLKERIAQLERLIFSAKRERFVAASPSEQGSLFEGLEIEEAEVEIVEEEETVTRKKIKRTKKSGGHRQSFPAHLRRETTELIPKLEKPEEWIKIGEDVTETLAYNPADIYVKRLVRPRYAHKNEEDQGIEQQPIPPRLIPKGMLDASIVTEIIIEKIQFHTPVYRFVRKLKLSGIDFIKQGVLHNALHRAAESLLPIYHLLQEEVLETGYVQADESHIKVLTKNKPGAAHRGQMWVYFAPTINATFFNYEPKRDIEAAETILDDFTGTLQCDGYTVYQHIANKNELILVHCWAHVRRKFFDARNSQVKAVQWILSHIQQLYKIEELARTAGLTAEQRQQVRQEKAVPILTKIKAKLVEYGSDPTVLPKSMFGKAIKYTLALWEGLTAYTKDGRLEIDNNLVENTIRPVALGRKNYLFAGSHQAAQNLAILYSIIGTCEKNGINTRLYLNWLFDKIVTQRVNEKAKDWLPHRVDKKLFQQQPTQEDSS